MQRFQSTEKRVTRGIPPPIAEVKTTNEGYQRSLVSWPLCIDNCQLLVVCKECSNNLRK